ncbi:ATP-dependent sacrificial sulfur transferase LarE [Desulforamulus ferrireducens]|uniref:TIGR00268 family protein n=1 Tax=Desulforamulus ferrireducens TaxID=1833852 RepID=A0A1S6IT13_9FIRM|nr:ATP-dependent sacrificial sulfur transferase LarE [Desulforamulus ferrireducens]AQS57907.1 TIGR00268 family protein [Desulforamulus ferrireducens]
MLGEKYQRLKEILRDCHSVLVGFSGGADSALLLAVAAQELGERVLAVTATSPTSTRLEIQEAQALAKQLAVKHLVIESKEMQLAEFIQNTPQKCYHCKWLRYSELKRIAQQANIPWVLDGSNLDDLGDFRPGRKALQELGIRSPLQEAGFTKAEVRELSRQLALPTWNKPSSPCLATRIPFGQMITEEKLRRVEAAEEYLRKLGFAPLRVRHFPEEARLEIAREQFNHLLNHTEDVYQRLKELGFSTITLDLAGFRSGSMNETLSEQDKRS